MCQSQITLLPRCGVVARLSSCNGDMSLLDRVGSQVCFFSTFCWYPCCVSVFHCTVSSAYTSVHNLATHVCHLPYNCHLHSPKWTRLCHTKVACHISCIVVAPALTETRRFGIFFCLFHNNITLNHQILLCFTFKYITQHSQLNTLEFNICITNFVSQKIDM